MSNSNDKCKKFSDLGLSDPFLFDNVFSQEEIMRVFLEFFFQRNMPDLTFQKCSLYKILSGGRMYSRQDTVAVDRKGNTYDIEITDGNDEELPHFIRRAFTQMDHYINIRGQIYPELPETHVIVFCRKDPFGYGNMVYTPDKCLYPGQDKKFDDGRFVYFVNMRCSDFEQELDFPYLSALLRYMRNSQVVDRICELTELISRKTVEIKSDKDKEEEYMLWAIWDDTERERARIRGKQEGGEEYASALKALGDILKKEGKSDEFVEAASNSEFAEELFQKYHITH